MLILIKDIKDIKSLINQAIKINTKIYQRERVSKSSNTTTPINKAP